MTFHLGVNGTTFAQGSTSIARGSAGLGFFRLALTVGLVVDPTGPTVPQSDAPELVDLTADLTLAGKPLGRFLAPVTALPVRSYPARANNTQVQLECDLDRARIEAIEAARAGGNLALDVYLAVRFSNGERTAATENLYINQGVWVSTLQDMGYQRTLLVEVPLRDASEEPEMAAAVELLAQAQAHMLRGQDRDAVGACRDVLEEITRALGDDDNLDPYAERLFRNSRAMTKAERLRVLRRALKLVTHPARHRDQVSVGFDWSRIDAAAVITMTAALLNEMDAPDARPSNPVLPPEPPAETAT